MNYSLIILIIICILAGGGVSWLAFRCPVGGSPSTPLPNRKASPIVVTVFGIVWGGILGLSFFGPWAAEKLPLFMVGTICVTIAGGFVGNHQYGKSLAL
ncbi:MAG: hypothetical protein C0508_19960 [Cyanobacteria bacterium PR.023]|nr:hypothetical protein [Cyanobacteria bacterium PR.023]